MLAPDCAACLPAQKTILKTETVTIPDGVTVTVKTRKLTVKGPRGTLNMDLSHLPIDLSVKDGVVKVERWFTSGKQAASCLLYTSPSPRDS